MPRFKDPGFVSSLKEAKYWSLDWIAENAIEGPFDYVILLKDDNGYKTFGKYATVSEAFEDRRRLCEEHGTRSFFLRALRLVPVADTVVVAPGSPESREDLDRYRDALSSGDTSLIAPEEVGAFRQWAAREIEDRPLYQPTSRVQHSEIPF
jgi:hypothetical protein